MKTIIRSGRSPFELWLLVASVTTGITGLLKPQDTAAGIARALPTWELYAWYGGIAVGAAVALTGLAILSPTGLLLERMGLWVLTGMSLQYAVELLVIAGLHATVPAAFTAGFAAACVSRIRHISRDLRAVADLQRRRRPGKEG